MISIIFPHAMNKENDKVLNLKLEMLEAHATHPYELLILSNNGRRTDLVYEGWDWMMRRAKHELILWDNSDIVYGPNFMENVIKHKDDADWLGLELVECGNLVVAQSNMEKDFGRTCETFRRKEFEDWVIEFSKNRPSIREGFCWYSPSVWKKSWYIEMGGFDINPPFPHPNDMHFRNRVTGRGCRFAVVNSFAYHFQRAPQNRGELPELS